MNETLDFWLDELQREDVPRDEFQASRRFVIYGAGGRGREALKLLRSRGCEVLGFLDEKANATIDGVRCVRLENRQALGDLSDVTVLVAIFNPHIVLSPVFAALRTAGFTNLLSFYDLNSTFSSEIGDFHWLTRPAFWREEKENIARLASLFEDVASRATLAGVLALRLKGDFGLYEKQILLDDQYFPPGVADWKSVRRLLDCGAYDGDTIGPALRNCSLEMVAAFEPDARNFAILARRFREGEFAPATGLLWPCGAWSSTGVLRFKSGQGEGSHLADEGDTSISVTALDDAVYDFAPDYIKMDIEGAEQEALDGARQLIERYRPSLALCLYHKPAHLWQIPFQLLSWDLDYRFALRTHCYNGFDTVLYAIPRKP